MQAQKNDSFAMKVFETRDLAKSFIALLKKQGKSIGFVPTMGALHQGHISLIQQAKKENDIVVASIFVNPTQFNNPDDLKKYPKTFVHDVELLKSVTCDAVFAPQISEMYEDGETAQVFDFEGLDKVMEGKYRDNHFNGVGTIVKKLFDMIHPTNAYFGEKDFQQLQIIKKLVEITNLNVNIVGCAIHREKDGLAMSSRNVRLSNNHRKASPFIYQTLLETQKMVFKNTPEQIEKWVKNQFEHDDLLELEYFTIAKEKDLKPANSFEKNSNYRAFIAVYAGDVRLIDNIALSL